MQILGALVAMSLLAGPAMVEEPRRGCDVSVTFKARQGKIDTESLEGVTSWLNVNPDVTGYDKVDRRDGGVRLCIKTAKPQIREVFKAVALRMERNHGRLSAVKIENRYGGLIELPRGGYTRAGSPYDNRYTGRPSRADLARTPLPK